MLEDAEMIEVKQGRMPGKRIRSFLDDPCLRALKSVLKHLFVTLSPFREPLVPFQTALFLAIMGLEKRSFVDLFWQVSPKY